MTESALLLGVAVLVGVMDYVRGSSDGDGSARLTELRLSTLPTDRTSPGS